MVEETIFEGWTKYFDTFIDISFNDALAELQNGSNNFDVTAPNVTQFISHRIIGRGKKAGAKEKAIGEILEVIGGNRFSCSYFRCISITFRRTLVRIQLQNETIVGAFTIGDDYFMRKIYSSLTGVFEPSYDFPNINKYNVANIIHNCIWDAIMSGKDKLSKMNILEFPLISVKLEYQGVADSATPSKETLILPLLPKDDGSKKIAWKINLKRNSNTGLSDNDALDLGIRCVGNAYCCSDDSDFPKVKTDTLVAVSAPVSYDSAVFLLKKKGEMEQLNADYRKIDASFQTILPMKIQSTIEDPEAEYSPDGKELLYYIGEGEKYSVRTGCEIILKSAFTYSITLKSIDIPAGLQKIEDNAFMCCSSLQSVVIPQGVEKIGSSAFYDCTSLQSVVIPQGVEKIGSSAFRYCSSLQSVTIPQGVKEIDSSAFEGCYSLQSVTLPQGVKEIDDSAFKDCSSLQSVVIPQSVEKIGDSAFKGCSSLQKIESENFQLKDGLVISKDGKLIGFTTIGQNLIIPEGVTTIQSRVFSYCNNIETIVFPKTIKSIEYEAFYKCNKLQTLNFPKSLVHIGKEAFSECKELKTITFSEGLLQIGEKSFFKCIKLQSLEFPESLMQIESFAFSDCYELTSIIFKGCPMEFSGPFRYCDKINCVTFHQEGGAALKYFKGARFKGITLNVPEKKK